MIQETVRARARQRMRYTGETYAQALEALARPSAGLTGPIPEAHNDIQRRLECAIMSELLDLAAAQPARSVVTAPPLSPVRAVRPFVDGLEMVIAEGPVERFCADLFGGLLRNGMTTPAGHSNFAVLQRARAVEIVSNDSLARIVLRELPWRRFQAAVAGGAGVTPKSDGRTRGPDTELSGLLRRLAMLTTPEEIAWAVAWHGMTGPPSDAEASASPARPPERLRAMLDDPIFGITLSGVGGPRDPDRSAASLLHAAQLAVDRGDVHGARRLLAEAIVQREPLWLQVRWWHLRARLELAAGMTAASLRAATTGLRRADAYLASLGSIGTVAEQQSFAEFHAATAELAALRLRVALDHGDPGTALVFVQRCRAAALSMPPPRSGPDPAVARHLIELRRISGALAGAPAGPRAGRLLQRQRSLEDRISRRSRQAPRPGPDVPADLSLAALAEALGERLLVELFELDGVLHALVVRDKQVTHRVLGPATAVTQEVERLQIARTGNVLGQYPTSAARIARSVAALEKLLLEPLAVVLGEHRGPLVLVPSGALHTLPWRMLPQLRGRSLCVASSTADWLRLLTQQPIAGPLVLVGAPSSALAGEEIREIAAERPDSVVLAGEAARVAPALAALDGAGIGHIACHGEFRADNPLFSSLMLADGPLTVHDLTALRRPPGLLVLSGCDTGLTAGYPGGELMGFVAALLNMGAGSVIAATGPVDDIAVPPMMRAFHRFLAAGHGPAAALAAAQDVADPADRASTDSFVCFGAG